MTELSTEQLQEIAHRCTHYERSHGSLPFVNFPKYTCCERPEEKMTLSYSELKEILSELIERRSYKGIS